MKDYEKNKELSYFKYWDVNNLYRWGISQKLPVNGFKWIENASQVNKDFTKKAIMKIVMKGIFLMLMFNVLKNYMTFTLI